MNFIKTLLASLLGSLIALFLVFIILFGIIGALISGAENEQNKPVAANSILHIQLDEAVIDRGSDNDFNFNPATFDSESRMGLNHFVKDLERAAKDENIKGIYLEMGAFAAAPSAMLDMHNAIKKFKESGKWVVAYGEDYSQGGYFVASAASEVYLYPTGSMDWRGINVEVTFFKNMLDKLEIEAQVIRGPNNKFKSAVEPFIYDKMSEANREQMKTFIDDIWNTMLNNIAANRGISVESLNMAADSLALMLPEKAVELKMIDGLKYRDEVIALMKEKTGASTMDVATATEGEKKADDGLSLVALKDYHKTGLGKDSDGELEIGKDRVAVIYAVGAIESGEGDDATIGSDRIAKALKEARENEKVKAVVLRVNSPGGSALASDVIWRETELLKAAGKPFVVSMGDYAASGGYYISCSADKIFANPNTITGSIGVFGILPNVQGLMENKLGITFDRYETNPHADMISTNKPLDEFELKAMQTMVADIYDDFTSKVAKGRNKTQAEIDSIGQGRVWSGEDALQIGLVDELGDLNAAIAAAAGMAGLQDYSVKELPKLIDPFEKLMEHLTGQKQTQALKTLLGDQYSTYEALQQLNNMKGIQARLPFSVEIK